MIYLITLNHKKFYKKLGIINIVNVNSMTQFYQFQVHMKLKIKIYIQGNGKTDKNMEEENKYGQMDQYMKDIGVVIKQMVKVD